MGSRRTAALLWVLTLAAVPASAQIDLTGSYNSRMHEDWFIRGPGQDLADYTGLALSDEARAAELAYEPTLLAMRERQCLPYSPYAFTIQPGGFSIWSELDAAGRIIAWKTASQTIRMSLTIWMDGRPHPSENAFYPFSGFTTGRWDGDVLVAHTSHIKAGYLRRNGVGSSDKATADWRIFRHGDFLTVMVIVNDPVYLIEPDVVTRVWALDPKSNMSTTSTPCVPVSELPRIDEIGVVPHHLPGKNPDVNELTERYGIPREAVLGFPETLYPEYRKKLKAETFTNRNQCNRYCCGWVGLGDPGSSAPGLSCITNGTDKPNFTPLGNPFIPPPPRW